MFLIDAIKPKVEKKFNLGERVMRVTNETISVSFRVRFVRGIKNIIQRKRENVIKYVLFFF